MGIWRLIFDFDHQLEMYKPVAKHRWALRIADLVRRPAGGLARGAARDLGSGSLAETGRQTAGI